MDLTTTPDDAAALDAILNHSAAEFGTTLAAGRYDHIKNLVELIREASGEMTVSSRPGIGFMAKLAKATVLEGPGGQPIDPMLVQPGTAYDGMSPSLRVD